MQQELAALKSTTSESESAQPSQDPSQSVQSNQEPAPTGFLPAASAANDSISGTDPSSRVPSRSHTPPVSTNACAPDAQTTTAAQVASAVSQTTSVVQTAPGRLPALYLEGGVPPPPSTTPPAQRIVAPVPSPLPSQHALIEPSIAVASSIVAKHTPRSSSRKRSSPSPMSDFLPKQLPPLTFSSQSRSPELPDYPPAKSQRPLLSVSTELSSVPLTQQPCPSPSAPTLATAKVDNGFKLSPQLTTSVSTSGAAVANSGPPAARSTTPTLADLAEATRLESSSGAKGDSHPSAHNKMVSHSVSEHTESVLTEESPAKKRRLAVKDATSGTSECPWVYMCKCHACGVLLCAEGWRWVCMRLCVGACVKHKPTLTLSPRVASQYILRTGDNCKCIQRVAIPVCGVRRFGEGACVPSLCLRVYAWLLNATRIW